MTVSRSLNSTAKQLCTSCKHYYRGVYSLKAGGMVRPAGCDHPNNASLIDGSPRDTLEQLRYGRHVCGPEAKWWEAKS